MFLKRTALNMRLLFMFVLAAVAVYAHVTVQPRESLAGATEKYTIRVPNEKNVPTLRLEVEFPAAAEITAVDQKAGWIVELKKDSSGKIIGAIWSGSTIAPREVVEFGFTARNPAGEITLVWKAVQVYDDASRSEWTGTQGSRSPAPATQIKPH